MQNNALPSQPDPSQNGASEADALLPWRQAGQDAMLAAREPALLKRYGDVDASFNYRWEHVSAVVTLALKLADLTGADPEVIEAAAWLHDVRKDAGRDHPKEGAIFARNLLPQTDFPAEKIERVAKAIEDHMGLYRDEPLTELESQVLWDADKLSKLGLTAAFHWTGGSLAGGRTHTMAGLIRSARKNDWQGKTVESMHTEPAKRAAKKRLKAYKKLWKQLKAELNGDDLELE